MPAHEFQMATGHDNPGGLTYLHALNPPNFELYRVDVRHLLYPYESRRRAGDRSWAKIGRPYLDLLLAAITPGEYKLLLTTYCNGVERAPVTVRAYDPRAMTWGNYNGQFNRPDPASEMTWRLNGWQNVRITIDDLEAL